MGGFTLSSPSAQPPTTPCSSLRSRTNSYTPLMSPSSPSTILFKSPKFQGLRSQRIPFLCHSSTPGGPSPGDSGSRDVLDAFFLGKALAEAVSERVESTIGEFLSTVGRLQAEQQKQVQEFQEEVFEKAKRAKEKAARESFEVQAYISISTAATTGQATDDVSSPSSSSTTSNVTPVNSSPSSSLISPDGDGPTVGVSNED